MARLPDGDVPPRDGALPGAARGAGWPARPFGVYVHVPFCAARCGYCDFNTYTAAELPGGGAREAFAGTARAELALARRVLGDGVPPASTVFFGGGTPTLLPAADLAAVLRDVRATFGLAPDAEVTTEANPESVDPGLAGGAARGRLHAHLVRDAERRAARAARARPRPHARPRRRRPCARRAPPASSTSAST